MLPPYTTTRQGASACYATTVHHNKTTRGIIMLCYHRTQQDDKGIHHAMLPRTPQNDKGLHHVMLPPYTTTRRQGTSSCYATTVHHSKTTRASLCYATTVHHNKTTRGIIMLCYHSTAHQDDGGLHHAMLPPYTTITIRQGASSCYATTVHHSKTTEGIIMLCYHRTP